MLCIKKSGSRYERVSKKKKFMIAAIPTVSGMAAVAHKMKKNAKKTTYEAESENRVPMRKMGFYEKYIKRMMDVVCATGAIVCFSPIYLGVAVLVRLKLGSPVLFTQDRPGLIDKNGKETVFKMYKFRTMTDERDENGELLPDEIRLTKFGKWLRSTSLDELPEAFNILNQEVPKDLIVKAIKLAKQCPSACNRQATRLYVVNHKKKKIFSEWLSGTGGFDEEIKEFILVCAKTSAYMPQEYQQYEVSTGIFVGYLTLALQAYGIGSCVIQRDVLNTKAWRKIANKLNIPYDEQIVCILGCGIQDTSYPVPISHRFDVDEIAKFQ